MRRIIHLTAVATAALLGLTPTAHAQSAEALNHALTSGNFGAALGFSFVAGLLSSLTPCVYPMIGITVSIFGASQAKTKLHGAGLSSMYMLGVCSLFSVVGVASALMGWAFGSYLASAWFVIPLCLVFVAMAASMFGAFEMNLPPSLQNKLAQMGGLGPKGAFVLGLVGGLIAAPCTGPIVTPLLVWISTTRNAMVGGSALFIYGIGLALPTWLVGTFAISLPRSGRWLEWTKSAAGLGMLLIAIYFARDFIFRFELYRNWVLLLGGLGVFAVGLAIGAIHLSFHHASKLQFARKLSGILVALGGATAVLFWFLAPPPPVPGSRLVWLDNYESARHQALSEGRPLLVDFGASWCLACNEMDRNTFSDPRVVTEGRRFVAVHVDLSPGPNVAHGRQLLAQYHQPGLPLVVLHGSDGDEAVRVIEYMEPDALLERMRRVR